MDESGFRRPGYVGDVDPRFMMDRVAIQEVAFAFGLFYDAGDFDALAELFTEDARYVVTPSLGPVPPAEPLPPSASPRDRILAQMAARRELNINSHQAYQRHFTTNTLISSMAESRAETTSQILVIFAYSDGRQEVRRTGVYSDILRKEESRWRIARRHLYLLDLPTIGRSDAGIDAQPPTSDNM